MKLSLLFSAALVLLSGLLSGPVSAAPVAAEAGGLEQIGDVAVMWAYPNSPFEICFEFNDNPIPYSIEIRRYNPVSNIRYLLFGGPVPVSTMQPGRTDTQKCILNESISLTGYWIYTYRMCDAAAVCGTTLASVNDTNASVANMPRGWLILNQNDPNTGGTTVWVVTNRAKFNYQVVYNLRPDNSPGQRVGTIADDKGYPCDCNVKNVSGTMCGVEGLPSLEGGVFPPRSITACSADGAPAASSPSPTPLPSYPPGKNPNKGKSNVNQ